MLYASVWESPEFVKLSLQARLLYIGMITFADDDGRLRGSSELLKSKVFPEDTIITSKMVRVWMNEIVKVGLITFYKVKEEYYIEHPKWLKYQRIRGDIYEESNIPAPQKNRNKKVTQTLRKPRTGKVRLGKDREEKGEVALKRSPRYLKEIPEEDLNEFHERFDCSKSAIKSKGEDLALWCESKGKAKRDYRAFLLVALKKDFPPRRKVSPEALGAPRTNETVDKVALERAREEAGLAVKILLGKAPPKKEEAMTNSSESP
jgi:hypothetical protein